jgi:cellobiose phosphorylase
MRKHLFIKCGLKLLTPAYGDYNEKVGPVGVFGKGLKENGAVFNHAHAWGVMATAMAGKGDWAQEYYNAGLPYFQDPNVSTMEPYAFCQTYVSDEHPEYGLGRLHWHSGTVPWTFVASTQHILGVRSDFKGLIIDPSIPKNWKSYKVTRYYRGIEYQIEVQNPNGKSRGLSSLKLDGKDLEGNFVPLKTGKKKQSILAVM